MTAFDATSAHYFPHFQPIVDLVTGRIGGYEALARYRQSNGKITSAGALFQAPEKAIDTVLTIDRHVRQQALERFAMEPDAGFLTLNLSPAWIDLLKGDTSPTMAMIDACGIDPARVVIEITEGHGELKEIQRLVENYHAAGLRVAIDDFGAGASQIDRIAALNPDIIKLDMQLFKAAARGGISADVTLAAASIAERIGCDIVCEGVETLEEFHFSIECGARYVQGFIFYPALGDPLPAQQVYEQVREFQQSYLARKSQRLKTITAHNRRIHEHVIAIRSHYLAQTMTQLDTQALHREGILRYYLCQADGTQVSDNIEIQPEGLESQPWGRQCNWSHRPYFPLLLALRSSASEELVVSNKYRDTLTHSLCKTYCTYINEDLILLVDVAVDDDVLYADLTEQQAVAAARSAVR